MQYVPTVYFIYFQFFTRIYLSLLQINIKLTKYLLTLWFLLLIIKDIEKIGEVNLV